MASRSLPARAGADTPEAIIPEPAFEIFTFDTEIVGGRPVRVEPNADYSFPLERVLDEITPNTRVVFVTSPNNPTGVMTSLEAIRMVASRVPPGAVVFVDEAYAEFSGVSFIPELERFRNVVVGRTFSKAFGLAGLRMGAITGHPDTLEPIRLLVPVRRVYRSIVAVRGGMRTAFVGSTRHRSSNRRRCCLACDRLGLYGRAPTSSSSTRARAEMLARRGTAARHLHPGSVPGGGHGRGLRVGEGIVAHTQRCIDVFEEVLCDAR